MSRHLIPMVLGLSVLVAGCRKEEQPKVTPKEVEKKVAEAAGTATDYARQEKDEYVARAEKAIDEAKAEIDGLKAETKRAQAGAKRKLRDQIEARETAWQRAKGRLEELKSATGEAWKDLRERVDKAVEDLKKPAEKPRSTGRRRAVDT